jgi:thiol:disulfide interchange protein
MKKTLFLFAIVLSASFLFTASASGQSESESFGPVLGGQKSVVTIQSQFTAPRDGRPGYLFVTAKMASGWHIYSITQPPGGPVASKIQVSLPQGVRFAGDFQANPAPHRGKEPEAFGDLPIESHEDAVTWHAPLEFAAGVDAALIQIPGKVLVQACDAKSCIAPEQMPFVAKLGVAPYVVTKVSSTEEPLAANAGRSVSLPPLPMKDILWQLGLAFLGGLILNLMPCVLPVISLKILSFLEQAGESRARIFALNVWYSAGLLLVFMVLAALAATAGLAWGEQFTLPWFKVAMTVLVFAMALSFLGVWEIPIPGFVGAGKAGQLQTKEGPSGAFFKGVFATILATPCSGPFLGPVFGYLLNQPPYMAYWTFAFIGFGMASPYLVIGVFPQLIRFLPRPGAWIETVQQLMGFLLLATVVYLFTTLSAAYFVPTLALLVGLWFACWWIGRTPLTATAGQRNAARIGGPIVAALVGVFAFTVLFQESKIPWQPFSPEALQRARAEGKTVMVDFSADWCLTCKWNLKFAIETNAVRDLVKANGIVPMLADWTSESPTIKKALNELGRNSIPTLAIYPADPPEGKPMVLSDLLYESQVLDALKKAGPSKTR